MPFNDSMFNFASCVLLKVASNGYYNIQQHVEKKNLL